MNAKNVRALLAEANRRKVFRVGAVYTAAAFVVLQVADLSFPALGFPDWTFSFVLVLTMMGFPITVALAWAFDVVPSAAPSSDGTAIHPPLAHKHGKSIAVLPFLNMSADPANEYFGDGMTEELINALSNIPELHVASRTSSFCFKNDPSDVQTIGERLNVATVLEGSVRKAEDRLRITAQLIEVATGYHVWSGTFDTEMRDVFAIQEDISQAVVRALRLKLGLTEEEAPLVRRYTDSVEAYNTYLLGLFHWNMGSEPEVRLAIDLFNQAIQHDPTYALAYSGLADAYNRLGYYNYLPPSDGFGLGKQAALRALGIDDRLPAAHASLAYALMHHDWDWPQAERAFQQALRLDPRNGTAHRWHALYLAVTGDLEASLLEAERARELDPLSPIMHSAVGRHYYFRGDYDRAIEEQEKALQLYASFIPAVTVRAQALLQIGRVEEAQGDLSRAVELSEGNAVPLSLLGYAYARAGRLADAQAVLHRLQERSTKRYVSAYCMAVTWLGMDDVDRALELLNASLSERSNWLVYIGVDPLFRELQGRSGFRELLDRTGIAPPTLPN